MIFKPVKHFSKTNNLAQNKFGSKTNYITIFTNAKIQVKKPYLLIHSSYSQHYCVKILKESLEKEPNLEPLQQFSKHQAAGSTRIARVQVKETRWPALCSILSPFLKGSRTLKEIHSSIFCSFSLYVARDRPTIKQPRDTLCMIFLISCFLRIKSLTTMLLVCKIYITSIRRFKFPFIIKNHYTSTIQTAAKMYNNYNKGKFMQQTRFHNTTQIAFILIIIS